MICILPFRLMGCESRLCDHNRFHRQSPEFDNHDNQPARWIEADSALPAGTTLLAGRQFPFCKGRGQFPPKRSRPSQKPRQR